MTNHYEYNISAEYNRSIFEETVSLLTKNVKSIESSKYFEDPLDEDQMQIIRTPIGEIKVINDFMVGAVWVESETNLDDLF